MHGVVGVQVDLLVLQRAPEPLDEDVVVEAALAIHADLDPALQQYVGEIFRGELRALVRVENLWATVAVHGFVQGLHAEARLQRVGQAPGEHPPRIPIDDRHQVDEASCHRDVGDVGGPHLIDPGNRQIPQQIGVYGVLRRWLACVRLGRCALEPHQPHQPLHALAVHQGPLSFERLRHHAAAEKRMLQM